MSDKAYFSELERALARSDVDDLRAHLRTYRQFSGTDWPDEADEHIDAVMTAHWHDPERGMAYVVLAMAEYDDADFLGVMSAGLLEDLLQEPSSEFVDRIAVEARKTARLRWMLGVPYRHAIQDWIWDRLEGLVVEDVDNTPLPPAPCA